MILTEWAADLRVLLSHLRKLQILFQMVLRLVHVQVPSHGKPIILLSDRQTTGGYAKIATVISVDIPKIVQRKTDHKIHFQAITVEDAQKLYLEEVSELDAMRKTIHQPCKEVLDCRLVAKRLTKLFE